MKLDNLYERRLFVCNPEVFDEIDKNVKYSFKLEKLLPGSHKKVFWISKICNHRFEMSIVNRIRSRSHCPYCCNQRVLEGFNDLKSKYPHLIDEWDFELNKIMPNDVTAYSHAEAKWICKYGHRWTAAIYSRTKHKNNCGVCSRRVIIEGVNDSLSLDTYNLKEEWSVRNNISIEDSLKTTMKDDPIWKCIICLYEWPAPLASRLKGYKRCGKCYTSSFLENTVSEFLYSQNIKFIKNKRPLKTSSNGKENLEIDFQLTEYPLGIEVQDFTTHDKDSDYIVPKTFLMLNSKKDLLIMRTKESSLKIS